jgi:hypothetical protein
MAIRGVFCRMLPALLLALFLTGCGGGKPEGTVSGKVLFKGNPVAGGTVNLLSAAGVGAQAPVKDGAYQVNGALAVGDYVVYLSPPRPTPQPPGSKPLPPPPFDVPVKYQDVKTSGLKVTVKAGSNTLPIEIKE